MTRTGSRSAARWAVVAVLLGVLSLASGCTRDTTTPIFPTPTGGSTSLSIPPPDPSTEPPPMNSDYHSAATQFCQSAALIAANVRALDAASDPVAAQAAIGTDSATFQTLLNGLLAAHSAQFGAQDINGVEPINSALAVVAQFSLMQAADAASVASEWSSLLTALGALGTACGTVGVPF